MKWYLSTLKEFIIKKCNHNITEDTVESFRNNFIDFVFVFTYYHDIMHLNSAFIDEIKKKIIDDNPRYFNSYTESNLINLLASIADINDNNNRYNEIYFNKYQSIYRLHEDGNFFRLYSILVNWNNNPLFNKNMRNIASFKRDCEKLRGEITHEKTELVKGFTWTGEKVIDTVASMATEIGDYDLRKLFKLDILSPRNQQFFKLIANCFKNWLFVNSGFNGMENFSDISRLLDTDFFQEHVIDTLKLVHTKYTYEFLDNGTRYKESKLFENYAFRIQTRKSLESYYHNLEMERPTVHTSYGPFTSYKFLFENGTVKIMSEKVRNFRAGIVNGFGTTATNN